MGKVTADEPKEQHAERPCGGMQVGGIYRGPDGRVFTCLGHSLSDGLVVAFADGHSVPLATAYPHVSGFKGISTVLDTKDVALRVLEQLNSSEQRGARSPATPPSQPERQCRTCRYWVTEFGGTSEARPGFCTQFDTYPKDDAPVELCAAGTVTAYTAPTFGCVLWRASDAGR